MVEPNNPEILNAMMRDIELICHNHLHQHFKEIKISYSFGNSSKKIDGYIKISFEKRMSLLDKGFLVLDTSFNRLRKEFLKFTLKDTIVLQKSKISKEITFGNIKWNSINNFSSSL